MGIFSSKNGKGELILVLDIGSSSVGGAFFLMQENKIPKIIYSTREQITTTTQVDFNMFMSLAMKSLNTLLANMFKKRLGTPNRIFCVLSSPWYISQTRVIHLEKNTPFIFTSKLADSLIEKEMSIFEEEYMKKLNGATHKFRPIEMKNIKTILNGYETSDPIDQKAKELEMTIFISLAGEEIILQIEAIISKYYHGQEVKFNSFTMASFAVVRDMYLHQDNFLLIDIGGEVTDISMAKKNILRESVSYPLGRNFILRSLAESQRCSINEAEATLSLYKDGHASNDFGAKLAPIMKKISGEWLSKFQTSLANLSNDISIPATIFLAVDKEYADFFSEIIKTEQFNQYTLTESKFQIILLGTESLHGAALFEESVVRDPFMIIESIYINRFFYKI